MDTLNGSPAVYLVNRDVRRGTIVTQSRSGGDQYQMFFKDYPGTVVLTRDEAYEAARRAGVDLGCASGSSRSPSRPLRRPRAQRDKRDATWSAREDEGGATSKKTRTTSIPREASDAMDRVFHHQVFARLLPPPEYTRVWCTVADDDVDAYVEGTVTRDDAGKLLDGQLDPYCEFHRRGGGEPWRGYVSRMDLIFAKRTR